MNLLGKKVGIWGFSSTGKSLVNYLVDKNIKLSVLEKRKLNKEEIEFFYNKKIVFYEQNNDIDHFLENNDFIISSPGVDLRKYSKYENKFLSELDLFSANFTKPIIAITGTAGKTTVTHVLNQFFLQNNIRTFAAGNIGIGMFDTINFQDNLDYILLEVSSFQLEKCKFFAPKLSIWTNFYPNHLDRHGNMDLYFESKFKIIENQKEDDQALMPLMIIEKIYEKKVKSVLNFFFLDKPSNYYINILRKNDSIFFIENNSIFRLLNNRVDLICDHIIFFDITFQENCFIIYIALYLYGININNLILNKNFIIPAHRMEKFASVNKNNEGIDFYNDSKSTIPHSTLMAVEKLKNKNIILFLGGLSKGVSRTDFIAQLYGKVKVIICFGGESDYLKKECDLLNIKAYSYSFLEDAVNKCFEIMQTNDKILFSPSGSSYDLFLNYEDRGLKFKELINKKIAVLEQTNGT